MEELLKDLREVFEKHGVDILLNSETLSIKDHEPFDIIGDDIYFASKTKIAEICLGWKTNFAKRDIIFRCSTLIPSTQMIMADEEILYPRYKR